MANIGPDGVAQIYPDGKGTQVYLKDNFDKTIFNVSYGGGSHIPVTAKKDGGLTYFNTVGSPITYNSGSKPGRSVRIDVYPGGGMWSNKTTYSWKKNPGYLYNDKGIKNGEFTIYARVHGNLGTHQAYAAKIGGRDDDAIRSLLEMVYPTATHNNVEVNYNYAHFPYVNVKPKIVSNPPKLVPEKWIGMKVIHIVAADNKSTHWEMWYDDNPFDSSGKPQNNWKLAATYEDKGVGGYGNVPLTWKCHKDLCRIDGFASVDFALLSDREIDPSGKGSVPTPTPAPAPGPKPTPGPVTPPSPSPKPKPDDVETADDTVPVPTPVPVEDDENSVEEVQEAKDWIKANPDEARTLLGDGPIDPLMVVTAHDKIAPVAKIGLSTEAVTAWIKANDQKAKEILGEDVVQKVTMQDTLHS